MPRILLAAAFLLLAGPAAAAPEWLLLVDDQAPAAGQSLSLRVLVTNPGKEPSALSLPAKLALTARLGKKEMAVEAVAADGAGDLDLGLAPGAFHQRGYKAMLPEELVGPVSLSIKDRKGPQAVALLQPQIRFAADGLPPLAQGGASVPPEPAAQAPAEAGPASPAGRLKANAEPALSAHDPMYLVVGSRGPTTAKFQLSFKYQMFDPRGVAADFLPAVSNLYFGYTQTALWDWGAESRPFRDTSYRPSLFYYFRDAYQSADGKSSLGFQAGYEHESNGKDGARSRSIDTLFVRPVWRTGFDSNRYLILAPRLWAYLDRADNPDIAKYRGYAELGAKLGRADGWQLAMNLRRGSAGRSALQADLSYPLRRPFFADAGGFLHFQYFNGYGESLLDYNLRRPAQFRIGFSIVR